MKLLHYAITFFALAGNFVSEAKSPASSSHMTRQDWLQEQRKTRSQLPERTAKGLTKEGQLRRLEERFERETAQRVAGTILDNNSLPDKGNIDQWVRLFVQTYESPYVMSQLTHAEKEKYIKTIQQFFLNTDRDDVDVEKATELYDKLSPRLQEAAEKRLTPLLEKRAAKLDAKLDVIKEKVEQEIEKTKDSEARLETAGNELEVAEQELQSAQERLQQAKEKLASLKKISKKLDVPGVSVGQAKQDVQQAEQDVQQAKLKVARRQALIKALQADSNQQKAKTKETIKEGLKTAATLLGIVSMGLMALEYAGIPESVVIGDAAKFISEGGVAGVGSVALAAYSLYNYKTKTNSWLDWMYKKIK